MVVVVGTLGIRQPAVGVSELPVPATHVRQRGPVLCPHYRRSPRHLTLHVPTLQALATTLNDWLEGARRLSEGDGGSAGRGLRVAADVAAEGEDEDLCMV